MEDDIQLPPLTPNMIIHGTNITLQEDDLDSDPESTDPIPARLARHLKRCKDALWIRWKKEYLRALREKHDAGKGSRCEITIGDIVLIKDDNKNRGLWKKGVVMNLIEGDGVVLGARLKTGENKMFERSVKHLYPLELRVDTDRDVREKLINDDQTQRPKRLAKNRALKEIKEITRYEDESSD